VAGVSVDVVGTSDVETTAVKAVVCAGTVVVGVEVASGVVDTEVVSVVGMAVELVTTVVVGTEVVSVVGMAVEVVTTVVVGTVVVTVVVVVVGTVVVSSAPHDPS